MAKLAGTDKVLSWKAKAHGCVSFPFLLRELCLSIHSFRQQIFTDSINKSLNVSYFQNIHSVEAWSLSVLSIALPWVQHMPLTQ